MAKARPKTLNSKLYADLSRALDPASIFKMAIGVPDEWQNRILCSDSRKLIVNASRQSGKSASVSCLALHRALYVAPGSTTLILGPSQRQSAEILKSLLAAYRKLGENVDDTEAENKLSVTFANKSRILALPGNGGDTVRGFSADMIIVDEASRVGIELIEAVRPMLATKQGTGRLVVLSTPWFARGWFYDIWRSDDPSWQRETVTAYDCARIDKAWLQDERREIGELAFRSEYLCHFVNPGESLFSAEALEASLSDDIIPLAL